jgi:hypothetical protein
MYFQIPDSSRRSDAASYEHRDASTAGRGLSFAARESGVFFSGRQRGKQRNIRRAVKRPGGTGDLNITVIPPWYSAYNGPAQLVYTKKEILDEIFDIFHSFTVD